MWPAENNSKRDGVRTERERNCPDFWNFKFFKIWNLKFQNWVFYLKLIKINNSKSKNWFKRLSVLMEKIQNPKTDLKGWVF